MGQAEEEPYKGLGLGKPFVERSMGHTENLKGHQMKNLRSVTAPELFSPTSAAPSFTQNPSPLTRSAFTLSSLGDRSDRGSAQGSEDTSDASEHGSTAPIAIKQNKYHHSSSPGSRQLDGYRDSLGFTLDGPLQHSSESPPEYHPSPRSNGKQSLRSNHSPNYGPRSPFRSSGSPIPKWGHSSPRFSPGSPYPPSTPPNGLSSGKRRFSGHLGSPSSSISSRIVNGSPSQSHFGSLIGSYENSLLSLRMSNPPSRPPLDFRAELGVIAQGKCKPKSLKAPPHVHLQFGAFFWGLEGSVAGVVNPSRQESPYVGTIELEQHYIDLLASTSGRQMDIDDPDPSVYGSPQDCSTSLDSLRLSPLPTLRERSSSPSSISSSFPSTPQLPDPTSEVPKFPGYRVPPKGQIQLIVKNPQDTAVKLFLVSYDFSDMPPGTKTFMRQKTYDLGSDGDDEMNVDGSTADCKKGNLKSAVHLQFCRLPETSSGKRKSDVHRTSSLHSSPSSRFTPETYDLSNDPEPRRPQSVPYIYLHKSIRVVFSSRAPERKEKLKVVVEGPGNSETGEGKYSPYGGPGEEWEGMRSFYKQASKDRRWNQHRRQLTLPAKGFDFISTSRPEADSWFASDDSQDTEVLSDRHDPAASFTCASVSCSIPASSRPSSLEDRLLPRHDDPVNEHDNTPDSFEPATSLSAFGIRPLLNTPPSAKEEGTFGRVRPAHDRANSNGSPRHRFMPPTPDPQVASVPQHSAVSCIRPLSPTGPLPPIRPLSPSLAFRPLSPLLSPTSASAANLEPLTFSRQSSPTPLSPRSGGTGLPIESGLSRSRPGSRAGSVSGRSTPVPTSPRAESPSGQLDSSDANGLPTSGGVGLVFRRKSSLIGVVNGSQTKPTNGPSSSTQPWIFNGLR